MYGPKCSDCGKKRGTQKSARQNTSQQTHIIQGQLVFEAKPGKKHGRWDSDVFLLLLLKLLMATAMVTSRISKQIGVFCCCYCSLIRFLNSFKRESPTLEIISSINNVCTKDINQNRKQLNNCWWCVFFYICMFLCFCANDRLREKKNMVIEIYIRSFNVFNSFTCFFPVECSLFCSSCYCLLAITTACVHFLSLLRFIHPV